MIAVVKEFFDAEVACCTEKVAGDRLPPSHPTTAASVMIKGNGRLNTNSAKKDKSAIAQSQRL